MINNDKTVLLNSPYMLQFHLGNLSKVPSPLIKCVWLEHRYHFESQGGFHLSHAHSMSHFDIIIIIIIMSRHY